MEIKNFSQFILEHKNCFEKRKYFRIDKDFKIFQEEPTFLLELAYIFCENKKNDEKILKILKNEFEKTFKEKEKDIKRLSKIEKSKLEDSFRRSLFNRESLHTVKLGNELFFRDKNKFFEILYNFSLISMDENKLVKTFFCEKMIEKIIFENSSKYLEIKFLVQEILKNILNYFTKSEFYFLKFENEKNLKYFLEEKVDALYEKIYMKNFDEIIERYNIQNVKKINFEKKYDFEKLSKSKKILFKYI